MPKEQTSKIPEALLKINVVSRVRKCPEQKQNGREGEIDKLLKNTDEERVVLDHKEKPC